MEEVWKDVGECKGYEAFAGLYEVSNMGRVRSLVKGLILKGSLTNDGYKIISLYNTPYRKTTYTHKLVALAFLPNPNKLTQINHIDEDKTNNRVDNLEWCTVKYNNNYGNRITKMITTRTRKVSQYTKQGRLLHTYDSAVSASKQFSPKHALGSIRNCLCGQRKTAYGYIWKYAD